MKSICFIGINNDALKRIPGDGVLEELSRKVGNCAMQLGVVLGLNMVDIEESFAKYPNKMFCRTFDVLKKWKNSGKVKPTNCILMKAMQESDPRGLMFLIGKYKCID
jgi:hypothetical protein